MNEERTAKKALQEIEHKMRTWKDPYNRKMEIFLEIAMQINSFKGKEQKFWQNVMDEYNTKYKN